MVNCTALRRGSVVRSTLAAAVVPDTVVDVVAARSPQSRSRRVILPFMVCLVSVSDTGAGTPSRGASARGSGGLGPGGLRHRLAALGEVGNRQYVAPCKGTYLPEVLDRQVQQERLLGDFGVLVVGPRG